MSRGTGGGNGGGGRRRLVSRREFLKAGVAAGGGAAVLGGLTSKHGRLIEAALNTPSTGSLLDIEHVVILMQENRSFDHYFGTIPGVRGFGDSATYQSYSGGPTTNPAAIFSQTMVNPTTGQPLYKLANSSDTFLQPFELTSYPPYVDGQTTNDITHDWGPQHFAWNNGAMDQWVVQHLENDGTSLWQVNPVDGLPTLASSTAPIGLLTMGYYRESDYLNFYRALAEAFTICDGYHCSVLGPTDPNRLMWMSGSLGAHSADNGGALLTTLVQTRPELAGGLDWPTMPEVLTNNGVSWKVYQDPTSAALFNVLPYFKNFAKPSTPTQVQNAANALTPVYPAEFAADVVAGTLPKVSWIMPPAPCCEHPATPPEYGEYLVSQILETLLLNQAVWEKTVFLVVYDENGGFFDHVAPPTPGATTFAPGIPSGLAKPPKGYSGTYDQYYDGEYLPTTADTITAAGGPPSDWGNIYGPVGLGFRVPALVISPLSAGGYVSSQRLDHISTLKLIEKVFLPAGTIDPAGGAQLHVSKWRYDSVGDFCEGLPTPLSTPAVGTLPATSLLYPDVAEQMLLNSLAGTVDKGQAFPPPKANSGVPTQNDPSNLKPISQPKPHGPPGGNAGG